MKKKIFFQKRIILFSINTVHHEGQNVGPTPAKLPEYITKSCHGKYEGIFSTRTDFNSVLRIFKSDLKDNDPVKMHYINFVGVSENDCMEPFQKALH